jgi:hypothetical protein
MYIYSKLLIFVTYLFKFSFSTFASADQGSVEEANAAWTDWQGGGVYRGGRRLDNARRSAT